MSMTLSLGFGLASTAAGSPVPVYVAPAFRSVGGAATNASGGVDLTPGMPAGFLASDILVILVETSNEPVAGVVGYAEHPASPVISAGGSSATALQVFWKRAVGGETSPTVPGATNHTIARIAAFSGCVATGNPWDVYAGNNNGGVPATSVVWPSVTTTVPNTMIVNMIAEGRDQTGGNLTSIANASLTALTERMDSFTDTGDGGGIAMVTGVLAAAGPSGSTTGSSTIGSASQARLTMALKGIPV